MENPLGIKGPARKRDYRRSMLTGWVLGKVGLRLRSSEKSRKEGSPGWSGPGKDSEDGGRQIEKGKTLLTAGERESGQALDGN